MVHHGSDEGRSPAHKSSKAKSSGAVNHGCSKTAVFVTASLIAAGGVLLVVGGILYTISSWSVFFGDEVGYAISITGGLVLLIAISGAVGASRHNRCCLMLYVLFLGIALLTLLALGPIYLIQAEQFDSRFEELWCENLEDASKAQTEFDCCGYNCPADKPAGEAGSLCPPRFVQPTDTTSCTDTLTDAAIDAKCDAYTGAGRGCKQMALDWMETRAIYIFILCLVVAVTSCIGIGTACAQICHTVPKTNRKGYMVEMMNKSIARIHERVTSERDFHEESGSYRAKKHAKRRPPPSAVVIADAKDMEEGTTGREPRRSSSNESRGSRGRRGRMRSRTNSGDSRGSRRSSRGRRPVGHHGRGVAAPEPHEMVASEPGPKGPLTSGSLGDSDLELERALAAC